MAHDEGRILIVEDLRDWQIEIQRILHGQYLSQFSYSIKIANTLQKARDLLKVHVYDLVLLDLRLSDWEEENFDGWTLMEPLAKLRKELGTQTIIVSAHGLTDHVRNGFKKYHIHDFIDKKRLEPRAFQKSVEEAVMKAYAERDEIVDQD